MDKKEKLELMADLLYRDEVYQIIGAAMKVYNHLGSGFLESVYHEAFEIENTRQSIPYESYWQILVKYKDVVLRKSFTTDFIFFECIIVEIKALERISGKEVSQILHYLKSSGLRVGLLINFGSDRKLEWKRFVY